MTPALALQSLRRRAATSRAQRLGDRLAVDDACACHAGSLRSVTAGRRDARRSAPPAAAGSPAIVERLDARLAARRHARRVLLARPATPPPPSRPRRVGLALLRHRAHPHLQRRALRRVRRRRRRASRDDLRRHPHEHPRPPGRAPGAARAGRGSAAPSHEQLGDVRDARPLHEAAGPGSARPARCRCRPGRACSRRIGRSNGSVTALSALPQRAHELVVGIDHVEGDQPAHDGAGDDDVDVAA